MATTIQPGRSIDIYLSAPSEYVRYHIVGLTGSMYVTDSRNLGSSFKYHFSIYTDRYYVYTGNTYEGSKPSSLNTIVRFSDYCDLYVGGDDGYPALYGNWVNDSNRAVIDNASLVFNYTSEYRARIILNYNGGTFEGQGSKDFGYSDWTTDNSVRFNLDGSERPIRNGYKFLGWSTNQNATSPTYDIVSTFYAPVERTSTLYAVWAAQTYTISYDANGGSGAPSSQTKTHGVTLTLSSTKPTRVGYEFLGWATSPTATSATYSAGGSYTNNGTATLYAVWKAKEYSVLYNGNGGTHSITGSETWEDTTNKFTFGKEYNISLETLGDKDFKYPGYNLLGWNTSWTATEPLTTLKIEKDEQPQLYAIWELGSNIRVYTNENWQIAIPYVYENGEWKLSISKVFNNEAWRQ